ncbi:MAG: hypothetical protein K6T56_12390 [Burkholderiales bacterium]|nr:hypothetical protein [Burkholderiales bacterium]
MVRREIDIKSLLVHLPLFRQLSDPDIAELARGCRELHPQRGETLFLKGDPAKGFGGFNLEVQRGCMIA